MEKKLRAAAMAAVYTCIRTEEEAAALQVAAGEALPADASGFGAGGPAAPVNLWGMTGRQAQMHANTLMQLRVFR